MAEKIECSDIWSLWGSGWICIPTAPENTKDRFPSIIGRFLVSRFPGLEKNYNKLCDSKNNPISIFRSSLTRVDNPPKKILVYHDLRVPLSLGDFGLILTPDTPGIIGNCRDNEETEWERIEKTVEYLKENIHLIPGIIYIPPLGFSPDGVTEEDAVDELMALLIDVNKIKIVYGIKTEKEEENSEEIVNPELPLVDNLNKTELPILTEEHGSLISNEFETLEVKNLKG